jgi:hypothetical protein
MRTHEKFSVMGVFCVTTSSSVQCAITALSEAIILRCGGVGLMTRAEDLMVDCTRFFSKRCSAVHFLLWVHTHKLDSFCAAQHRQQVSNCENPYWMRCRHEVEWSRLGVNCHAAFRQGYVPTIMYKLPRSITQFPSTSKTVSLLTTSD